MSFVTPIAILKSKERWRSQKPPLGAQIDWGHPLAKGLDFAWLFPNLFSLSSANKLGGIPVIGSVGRLKTTGSGAYGTVLLPQTNPQEWTVLTSLSINSYGGDATSISCVAESPGGATMDRSLEMRISTGVVRQFIYTSNGAKYCTHSGTHTIGKHIISGGASNSQVAVHCGVDGNLQSSASGGTGAGGYGGFSSPELVIGFGNSVGTGFGSNNLYDCFYWWRRYLPTVELRELHNNPYQFLYVPVPRTWFLSRKFNVPKTTPNKLINNNNFTHFFP